MRAVRVGEPGTVRVTDVPEPRLKDPRDAVVKVTAAAICGADLFPIHGMTPGFDDATVLGHEFTGTVADVGASVESVRVGQRVVCSSTVSDGTWPAGHWSSNSSRNDAQASRARFRKCSAASFLRRRRTSSGRRSVSSATRNCQSSGSRFMVPRQPPYGF